MAGNIRGHIAGLLRTSKRHTRYVGVLALLAVVVALGVTMGLRRNGRAATVEQTVLDCHAAAGVAHTHNADCYVGGDLVCPLQERELHTHDDSCYDEAGSLVCGKEEAAEEHVHGAGCFKTVTVTVDDDEVVEEKPAEAESKTEEQPAVAKDDGKGIHLVAQTFEEKVDLEGKKLDAADDLIVKVEAPEGALPEGTKMKVKAISSKQYLDSAEKEVKDKLQAEVETVQAVDIAFTFEGKEIEPKKDVHVSMRYADVQYTQDKAIEIVHVDDEYNADIVGKKDEQTEKDEVTFESDKFSVYAMVITTQHIASNGNAYDVTVSYGPEAKIPDGSTLRVTEIASDDAEYDRARNAVLADKLARGENVDLDDFNLAALDISIIDPSGKEIEPSATVKVDLKVKSLPEVEDLSEVAATMEVQHHIETGSKVIVETVAGGSADASFKQATDEKVIAKNKANAVDPNKFNESDLAPAEQSDSVETSFDTEVFSTYTISYYYNYYSNNIHYVDTNGNPLTPTMTPNFDARHQFLIYDIEGYEYDSTRLGSRTGTKIQPILRSSSSDGLYYSQDIQYINGNYWSNLNNNDIYVVYKAKTAPTQGGTPVIDSATSSDWPQDDSKPQFYKSSTNNGDGTNTVSLSINGGEKEFSKQTKANVIVVMDVSGSMDESLGGQSRINVAKNAVYDMADTLLNDMDGVKMALVKFSTTASTVQEFTDNYNTYYNAVGGLPTGGGTNWEQALSVANRMAVDSDAATFVVFVTDGDPTFRLSRGNVSDSNLDLYSDGTYQYYRGNNVFGKGNGKLNQNNNIRNFNAAVTETKSILASNKNFYAIGVSEDVTAVERMVNEAGGGSSYKATDAAALEKAFKAITQSIKTTLGFGDVKITDGITELANVEMKVMQDVDPESFTYYKITSSGQQEWNPASEGAGLASYDKETGAVTWNMGDSFQLEDGVTYMVTFRVWPSQEAYDLIAQLNNGEKVYADGQSNSISAEERAQVVELAAPTATAQGRYTLKTNTDSVNATYSQTSSTGETVTVSGETGLRATYHEGDIENMALTSQLLTIKKTFEDDLTAGEDRETEVTLVLKRKVNDDDHDMADYNVPGTTSPNIVLNDDNNWTYSFYVAPGFIVDDEVLEKGYQFTVTEPDIDYHYDLIEEIVNPMVVNGTLTLIGDTDDNQSLTAVNRVKSGIDIVKHVYDVDGITEIFPETEFTITGKLLGPDGNPYTWRDGDDVNASGAYHKYDKDGNTIVYKGHFADSSNISFTLKAGERVRFINVPEGCTFEFTESTTGMDALGYEWKSTGAVTQHRTGPGEDFVTDGDVQPVVNGQTASLASGVVGNKQYAITYTNQRTIALPDVELFKVDADGSSKKLNGAEFALYSDAELTKPVTVDGNGSPIAIKTGNKEGSDGPDGWYHIGLLPAGTYYLVETTAPEGYVLDETPVVITVIKGTSSYTVTATKNGESVISGPREGLYTITVDNERSTKYVKVFKYETGTNPEKPLKGAKFTLSYPEGTGVGDVEGLTTDADGYLVFADSKKYVELPYDKKPYTLTETEAPAGYNKMSELVSFSVTSDGVSATGSGYSVVSATEEIDGKDVTVYTIKVQNSAGVELPVTGGSGTALFNILGSAIAVAAVLTYGLLSRRSSEGRSRV